jgi:DNA-binding response OmpR family regulator
MHVLIVEDDVDIRELVEMLLISAGHTVSTAPDGTTGLGLCRHLHPDVMLLDVRMPGMNGYEVCHQVRADSDLDSVQVIMMTAQGQQDDIDAALESGANGHIKKPFSTRDLLDKVASLEPKVDAVP